MSTVTIWNSYKRSTTMKNTYLVLGKQRDDWWVLLHICANIAAADRMIARACTMGNEARDRFLIWHTRGPFPLRQFTIVKWEGPGGQPDIPYDIFGPQVK